MNRYEALETMLENILEHDADIETVLAEFPEFSEELRPLLQVAVDAQSASIPAASDDVMRRGRTRLLKHAAQMRDAAPAPRASFFDFRFAAAALTLLLVFFVGGTGLVRASSSALPGDGLYTVKRGWENTRVLFADDDETIRLQAEYENERREEVEELLVYSRVAIVQFEGVVTLLDGSKWEVAGVPVIVSEQTDVDVNIGIGSDVIVNGRTESDGVVLADEIILSHPEDEDDAMPIETPEEDADEPEESETPETDDEEDVGDGEDDSEDAAQIPDEDDESDSSDDTETSTSENDETPESKETPEPDTDEPSDDEPDSDEPEPDEPSDDEPDDEESDD